MRDPYIDDDEDRQDYKMTFSSFSPVLYRHYKIIDLKHSSFECFDPWSASRQVEQEDDDVDSDSYEEALYLWRECEERNEKPGTKRLVDLGPDLVDVVKAMETMKIELQKNGKKSKDMRKERVKIWEKTEDLIQGDNEGRIRGKEKEKQPKGETEMKGKIEIEMETETRSRLREKLSTKEIQKEMEIKNLKEIENIKETVSETEMNKKKERALEKGRRKESGNKVGLSTPKQVIPLRANLNLGRRSKLTKVTKLLVRECLFEHSMVFSHPVF